VDFKSCRDVEVRLSQHPSSLRTRVNATLTSPCAMGNRTQAGWVAVSVSLSPTHLRTACNSRGFFVRAHSMSQAPCSSGRKRGAYGRLSNTYLYSHGSDRHSARRGHFRPLMLSHLIARTHKMVSRCSFSTACFCGTVGSSRNAGSTFCTSATMSGGSSSRNLRYSTEHENI
jgi:hypothetical protein